MKTKFKLLAVVISLAVVSCQQEVAELEKEFENKKNENVGFVVKAGRIVFDNLESYINTYKKLSQYNDNQLKEWSTQAGIIPLQATNEEKEMDSIAYKNQLRGTLAYMYNKDGVLQYADTILVIKNEKIFSINDASELTLKSIQRGEKSEDMKNVVSGNHTTPLVIKVEDNPNGPMRAVKDRSVMYYSNNRTRHYADYEAMSRVFTYNTNYRVCDFSITGKRQLRTLGVWWGATEQPLKNSIIKYSGSIFGQNFAFGGPGVMLSANTLGAGVGPYVYNPFAPLFNLTVTYTFEFANVPFGSTNVITYIGEPL